MLPGRPGKFFYRYLDAVALAVSLLACLCRAILGQSEGMIYYVSLQGEDANPGTAERPWRHLEWAMTRPFLRGDDTIRLRQGVYRPIVEASPDRHNVSDDALIRPVASGEPGRPITVTAEPGETVVLSGRFLASPWRPRAGVADTYFYDYPTQPVFPFDHPFQVTEDGRLLYRVVALEGLDRPGRCFVDTAAQRIYVRTSDGRPPSAHLMEYGGSITGMEFLGGVRYWRLAGFHITGFRTAGVLIRDRAGSIELDHMEISYIGAHRPGGDLSSGHAIAIYDTSGGNLVHRANLHHTLAETAHISQTGAGGDLVEDNDLHDAGGPEWLQEASSGRLLFGPGLILRGSRTTVRGNRIYGNGYHGLILESDLRGSEGPAAPSENVVEGNVLSFNGGNGLYADGKNGLTASRANVIRFNLFDRNNQARPGGVGEAELRLTGNLDETLVYNNTLYAEKANGVLLYAGREAAGTAQGADAVPDRLRIMNNIVVLAGRAPSLLYPLRASDVGADLVSDYNNWYRTAGGPLVSWKGAELATLEEFGSKTGQERQGLSVDPRFVSAEAGWYWLRAISPLLGRGLADVRGDGAGGTTAATGAAPDLGAFPYRPLITLSRAELRFAGLAGGRDPAPQWLEIRSAGEKPIGWAARTGGEGWLRLTAAGGETPATLGVSARVAGRSAGSYCGTIQVTPALEGEPPIVVRVCLTVLPAPPRQRPYP